MIRRTRLFPPTMMQRRTNNRLCCRRRLPSLLLLLLPVGRWGQHHHHRQRLPTSDENDDDFFGSNVSGGDEGVVGRYREGQLNDVRNEIETVQSRLQQLLAKQFRIKEELERTRTNHEAVLLQKNNKVHRRRHSQKDASGGAIYSTTKPPKSAVAAAAPKTTSLITRLWKGKHSITSRTKWKRLVAILLFWCRRRPMEMITLRIIWPRRENLSVVCKKKWSVAFGGDPFFS